jgi:exosortase E/protease (VPEID-CTERM system)
LPASLFRRASAIAVLLAAELVGLSVWLDTEALRGRRGLPGAVHAWGAWTLRLVLAFAVFVVVFGAQKAPPAFRRIAGRFPQTPVSRRILAAHFGALLAFIVLSSRLFGGHGGDFLAWIWLAAGVTAMALAALAVMPLALWLQAVRGMGKVCASATIAAIAACALGNLGRSLWVPLARLTFFVVGALLRPFLGVIEADPASLSIGTAHFAVIIAPECSGLEGAGLMLLFAIAWLWICRRECRFPQAFVLIPLAVSMAWLLNAVRIAALILIGNAGAPAIAMGGFHSQAGWMAFIALALGFSVAARRAPWIAARPPERAPGGVFSDNPTAAYLVPFLAILASAMLSRAVSSGFEWLYPIRLFAAAAALWAFRRKLAALDWRWGWPALALGSLVFLLWLGLDRVFGPRFGNAMPSELAAWSAAARLGWLASRVLAAVVTVPIAEELAFRGFLLRRLISSDFESIGFRTFTYVSLFASSLAFGLLHGRLWMAGALAGLIYAFALLRRGRIGDAVAAHAATNALLAAWVLCFHQWHLW